MASLKSILTGVALAASTLVAASAADAATWMVNGTFADGTTVTGKFTVDVYGYLKGADLSTQNGTSDTGGNPLSAANYDLNNNASNGAPPSPYYIDLLPPDDQSELYIIFQDPLTTPIADNPIIGGYECQESFSCNASYLPPDYTQEVVHQPPTDNTRFFADFAGSASAVPEAATWAMMLLGTGLLGMGLRLRRRAELLAA
jgi:hypothetical protein